MLLPYFTQDPLWQLQPDLENFKHQTWRMLGEVEDETERVRRLNLEGHNFTRFPEQEVEAETSESEDEEDYREGGYHSVEIGETFKKGRYIVLQKLGWGHFSTVWLCFDAVKECHCAIKVQKSDPHYAEAAKDEIKLLKALKKGNGEYKDGVVALLDYFEHKGPNGRHYCLTFEVLSKSILSLMKRFNYKGIPLQMIRVIVRQILEGLEYIHDSCGIIHTDLKPENILFAHCDEEKEYLTNVARNAATDIERQLSCAGSDNSDPVHVPLSIGVETNPDLAFASEQVKLVDFGNACWITKHFTEDIQTRQYRAPEVILGCGYDTKADMWSLACLVFEMATGDFLLDPHSGDGYDRDEDHLALMLELLGPIPQEMRLRGKHSRDYLNENGELLHISQLNFWCLLDVLREKYKFSTGDAEMLNSFLMPMLQYDPLDRASAKEQLQHPFVHAELTLSCTKANSTTVQRFAPLLNTQMIKKDVASESLGFY